MTYLHVEQYRHSATDNQVERIVHYPELLQEKIALQNAQIGYTIQVPHMKTNKRNMPTANPCRTDLEIFLIENTQGKNYALLQCQDPACSFTAAAEITER